MERLGDHTFQDRDEWLHKPPEPFPERWQENMFFVAWDLDGGHGFLIHTKRWPAKGDHETHIVVYVDGVPSSAILHRPTGSTPRLNDEIPELHAEPEKPWTRWRIQAEIQGKEGVGPFGFLAYAPRGGTKATIDVLLESDLPPADFNRALSEFSQDLAKDGSGAYTSAQPHYEQGGRWSGTLTVGDRRIRTSGLYVRDHTWGERVESNFDSGVFWTASCLDDGKLFCNAIAAPLGDKTIGIGIVVSEQGAFYTRHVTGTFMPKPGLLSYDRTRITYGQDQQLVLEGRTKLHVPKYLPGSGKFRYDNNAISYVTMGGKTGMGCLEWASTLDPADALELERQLKVPAGQKQPEGTGTSARSPTASKASMIRAKSASDRVRRSPL
jgi:hypothetical protein